MNGAATNFDDNMFTRDTSESRARSIPLRPYLISFGLYSLLVLVSCAMGYRMVIPEHFYQFLSRDLLQTRLGESLLYLHSQPPLLNLGYGIGLALERASGVRIETIMIVFQVLLGYVAVFAFVYLARRMVPDVRVSRICLGVLLFHPCFYMIIFSYYYTYHEYVFLLMLACFVWKYIEAPSLWSYSGAGLSIALLAYSHSLYHWAWGLVILIALAAFAWKQSAKPQKARLAASLGLWTFVLLAWPLKNYVIFGVFASSSWQGYNIAQGIFRDPILEHDEIPERFRNIPALTVRVKEDGWDNWNHYTAIGDFRKLGAIAVQRIRENPTILLKKGLTNYWNMTRFAGRNPYTTQYGEIAAIVSQPVEVWMIIYEKVLFQDFRLSMNLRNWQPHTPPPKFWHISGFFLLFPVILIASAWRILRQWKSDPVRARTAAVLLYVVLWVTMLILFVDGNEGNRIRSTTEPYVILMAFWLWSTRRNMKTEQRGIEV